MTPFGRTAKRAFDATVAFVALLFLWPLFALIAILIKLDTSGPVFYRQERAGLDGEPFHIYKFRSMIVGAFRSGARLTVKRDPRITKVGQVLRWTKLDELPQFINVLVGDMSLVGPRPEDPYFVNFYSPEQRAVLSVRPGIIGPSQIDGRDEVEKYPDDVENVEEYYVQHILPEKLASDLVYVREATFWGDVRFLVGGVLRVAFSQFKSGFFSRNRYRFLAAGFDVVLMIASYLLASLIKFDWRLDSVQWYYFRWTLPWIILLRPPVFMYFGIYQRGYGVISRRDVGALVRAVSISTAALVVAATYLSGLRGHSRAVFIIDWGLLLFLLGGARYLVGHFSRGANDRIDEQERVNVLVAGSGHGGESILRSLLEDPNSGYMPVGIIDHEPHRWGALIHGVKVVGGATDIAMAATTHGVEMMLISLADLDPLVVREIVEACERQKLEYRLIPALSDMIAQDSPRPLKEVSLTAEGNV